MAAHHILDAALEETGLPLLSEESPPDQRDLAPGWERYWLVDPLDGTREFLARTGEFSINIALLTVSDTRGPDEDTSGDILAERIESTGHMLAARTILKREAAR